MNKILLIELAGIGDVVLSSPAIKNLRLNHPKAVIYFLSFSGPAQLLQKCPYLDKNFVFNKGWRWTFNNLRVAKQLRNLSVDIAVNLEEHYTLNGALKMYLLLKFIGPKKTVGRNTDGKGSFYNIKIEDRLDTKRNDVEYKLDLVRALGGDVKDKRLEVWFDDSDAKRINELLNQNSVLNSDLLIGINPGAYRPTRRWNWRNFAEVAEILAKRYRAKIIITGAKEEGWLAKAIISKLPAPAIDTTGKLSLTQLVALIKRCNLYITNNTGPMHIANALHIPSIVIAGPGPTKFNPYQKGSCIILWKDVKCFPCFKFSCKKMECLKTITADEVISSAEVLLKNYEKD